MKYGTLGYGDDECNFHLMSRERAEELGFVPGPDAKRALRGRRGSETCAGRRGCHKPCPPIPMPPPTAAPSSTATVTPGAAPRPIF